MKKTIQKRICAISLSMLVIGLSGCKTSEMTGKVLGENGNPIEGVTISFYAGIEVPIIGGPGASDNYLLRNSTSTDANGEFIFQVTPGSTTDDFPLTLQFVTESDTHPLLSSYVFWSLTKDSRKIRGLGYTEPFWVDREITGDDFEYDIQHEVMIRGALLTANLSSRHWHKDSNDELVFTPAIVDTKTWEVNLS